MKKKHLNLILPSLILIISSCATVFNSKTKKINITTSQPTKIILNQDTILTKKNNATIEVSRQKDPIKIKLINDSISKIININSKNSFSYWLNAYPTPILWTGFIIDKNNPKRYTFPSRIYISMSDTSTKYLLFDPQDRKGQTFINISLPWINSFYLKPDNEAYKSNIGFCGIAYELEYYHRSNQFLNLTASSVIDFIIPFPAAVDFIGLNERMSSSYFGLSNNHKVKNFSFGYGMSFTRNTWDLRYNGTHEDTLQIAEQPRKKSNNSIGFTFPIHYQLGHNFYVGIIYRPSFFRFSTSINFAYEQLISINFGWKLRLK
jgi:hypothetical protein